jgi:NADH-quinone oxidoreductase subunit M
MLLLLLLLIPFVAGLACFALPGNAAKVLALVSSLATAAVAALVAATVQDSGAISLSASWIPQLGVSFSLMCDGGAAMLCLLTGIVMTAVVIAGWNKDVERGDAFFGLMLLAQAGITGVFLAYDALLFYFFWELALIPVYFLCSRWGGEKRIVVTFKFFVYTFVGSLLMLGALIYLGSLTPGPDAYSWQAITAAGASLSPLEQHGLFWLLFAAFAVKMPIFPFHTWQPDTYEQAPTSVTIVLSALMVKMGLFAVLRWLLPTVPEGAAYWSDVVIVMSIIGIVYASCIAMVQTDLKRLVAYSSIAHMGLMCAAAFAGTQVGTHGLMVQMFNHGINITGMWLLVSMIENRYANRDMSKLGGMASAAPHMATALVVIAFANIALPLTNGFIGEFMLFHGIFQGASNYSILYMAVAGLGIILGAVYTLNMVRNTAWGNTVAMTTGADMNIAEGIAISLIVSLIIFLGIYPKPLLELTQMMVAG